MQNKKPLLLSFVLALIATVFIYSYVSHKEKALLELSTSVEVVVAAKDIPAKTALNEGMLEIAKIPRKYVQPGAITDIQKLIDRTINLPVLTGTQISEAMFLESGGIDLAQKIPKNLRAFTLSVSNVTAVANLLHPGNHVDLLVTVELGSTDEHGQQIREEILTRTFMQNVLVLAVDNISNRESAASNFQQSNSKGTLFSRVNANMSQALPEIQTLTLALSPEAVQQVNLAQEIGAVSVALRSQWDDGKKQALENINPKDLLGIDKQVLRKSSPAWMEIRGAEQQMYQ